MPGQTSSSVVVDAEPDEVQVVLAHPLADTLVLAHDRAPAQVSWHLVRGGLTALDGSYVLTPGGVETMVTRTRAVDTPLPMTGLLRRKAERTSVDGALRGLEPRVGA